MKNVWLKFSGFHNINITAHFVSHFTITKFIQNNILLIQGITTYSVLREGKFCPPTFFFLIISLNSYTLTHNFCAPLGYLGLPALRLTPLLKKLPWLHYPAYPASASSYAHGFQLCKSWKAHFHRTPFTRCSRATSIWVGSYITGCRRATGAPGCRWDPTDPLASPAAA